MKTLFLSLIAFVVLLGANIRGYAQRPMVLPNTKPKSTFDTTRSWKEIIAQPIVSYQEAKEAFEREWANKPYQKHKGYNYFKRWEAFVLPLLDKDGNYNAAGVQKRQLDAIQERQVSEKRARTSANANWTKLGPIGPPTPAGYNNNSVGRVECVAFHPTNSNIFYAGMPAGGLWKTTDGGGTWTFLSQSWPALGVSDIAIDPTNPNVIYVATGTRDSYETDAFGIQKSTDGGTTWTTLAVPTTSTDYYRLLMHPTQTSTLLLATSKGILKSINGGSTWTQSTGVNTSVIIYDMELKPNNPSIVYAVAGAKFFKSTDGGSSFLEITGASFNGTNSTRMALAVSAAAPEQVFVSNCIDYDIFEGLYRSENAGMIFTKIASGTSTVTNCYNNMACTLNDFYIQGWYDWCLAVSPTNASEIWLGVVGVFKTTDAGATWKIMSGEGDIHVDIHALDFQPVTNRLFVGSDGGLNRSPVSGTGAFDVLHYGISNTQMYRIGGIANNDKIVYAGCQDNWVMKYEQGAWKMMPLIGDGQESIIDPTNYLVVYSGTQGGQLEKSVDGGKSWVDIAPSPLPSGSWTIPFVMHPTNPQILLAGYDQVYKTTNGGSSWSQAGTIPGPTSYGNVNELRFAPSNPNTIYAIRYGELYVSLDGANTWNMLPSPVANSDYYALSIAVNPNNAAQLWVVLLDYNYSVSTRVVTSTNGGQTWTDYSGTILPKTSIHTIVYQKGSNNGLYLGSSSGVYYRDASLADWQPFSTGLPNVPINELEITYANGGKLRAATYGLGLWESNLYTVCTPPAAPNISATATKISVGQSATLSVNNCNGMVEWNSLGTGASKIITPTITTTYFATCTENGCMSTASSITIDVTCSVDACNVTAPNGLSEYYRIYSFSFNTIARTSGQPGSNYNDFTCLHSTTVQAGNSYPFSLVSNYGITAKIFIDYNSNGSFDDIGELVYGENVLPTHTGTITIPTNATTNTNLRMRVMVDPKGMTSCNLQGYPGSGSGIAEDYGIIITPIACSPPNPPIAMAGNRCGAGTVMLSASNCAGTYNWYDVSSGGNSLGSASGYTTPSISITTTYYVSCTVGNCTSTRASAAATINNVPSPPTIAPVTINSGQTASLTASNCNTGTVKWYNANTGGSLLFTGNPYGGLMPTTTTTYYASCTISGCESATRGSGTVTVNPITNPCPPTITHGTGVLAAGTYQAGQTISSQANISTPTTYKAGQSILLINSFQAGPNETFLAMIGGCTTAPTNGLVAYYPFNSNANDESGENRNLTNINATLTIDRKGVANRAYYFNGTAKLISDNVSYLYNTSFSISYWVKPDVYTGQMFIRSGPPGINGALHIAYRENAAAFTFAFYSNDYDITNFKKDSQWHQYTLIYDKALGTRKIFEDGLLLGSQPCNSPLFAQNTPLVIGYSWFDHYTDHLVGKLDDIRIYNRALTDTEVQALYQAEAPPIDISTGLVAHYKMDGNAQDASGNENHGTQQGGVNFTTATDRFGVAGKAAGFDGVNDYINLGNKISTFGGYAPFSISLWVCNITNKQGDYLSRYNQLVKGEFLVSNGESGIFFHREVSPWQLASNRILNINKWYMISCVYDGLKAIIYIDGQKVAEDLRGSSDTALLTNILIGAKYKTDVVGDFINSKLDEIRIYNRALADAEVLQIYNAEKP